MAFEFMCGEHNGLAFHCLNNSTTLFLLGGECMVLKVFFVAFK